MEPSGSLARAFFPGDRGIAPSEEALDPNDRARLRATTPTMSPAQLAQALREVTPEARKAATWNYVTYQPPGESADMLSSGTGEFSGPPGMLAGAGAGGAMGAGAIAGTLKPKWQLQSGQDRASIPRIADPDTRTLKRYFERGAKDPRNVQWYTESQKAGEMLAGEEEPLLRYFGAVFSQRKGPVPETNLAMKAFRAYKEQGVDGLWTMAGPSLHQRGELVRGALSWQNNPKTELATQMTPGSMKRRDYYGARGAVDQAVIDTHAGNAATRSQFNPEDPMDYYGVQHVYNDLADKAGVPRRGYQAAVWVPWREDQAKLRGVPAGDPSPAARILVERAQTNPDWQALVKAGQVPTPTAAWSKRLLYGLTGALAAEQLQPSDDSIAGPTFDARRDR